LFVALSAPAFPIRCWRWIQRRCSRRARNRAARQRVRLPAILRSGTRRLVATARDVSRTGVSVVSPAPFEAGTRLELSLGRPRNPWTGAVTVARCVARPSREGLETWLLGLEFDARTRAAAHLLDESEAA
jgi:hypothetical protein